MTRRFHAGYSVDISGIRFRVVQGRKVDRGKDRQDLRLEWWASGVGKWQAVDMQAAAFLADFFYENEEELYPQAEGMQGGRKFWEYLRWAMKHGWTKAQAGLRAEKAMRGVQLDLLQPEPWQGNGG
jgi:hypothetical protein